MKYAIIGLILLIGPLFSFGHNPLSASYYLKVGPQASILHINLSQVGLEQALLQKHGAAALKDLDPKQWKELIVAYVKSNFHLTMDRQAISLEEGGIKLGSHQTDLKFVLPPWPQAVQEIKVHIPAFQENDYHQSIFSYDLAGKKDKVILGPNNDYRATLTFGDARPAHNWWWTLWAGLLLIVPVSFWNGKP